MSTPIFIHQYAYTSVLHYLQAAEDGELRPATADEVTSIVFSVTDLQTGLAVVGFDGASMSPAAVMLDAIEEGDDSRWPKHSPFNFCHTLPDTAFPNAPRSYLYEATLGLASGGTTQVRQRFETLPIYGIVNLPTPDPGGGSEDPDPADPVTMFIVAVAPDPRTDAVSSISIIFSRAVTGFTIADLSLTRDGGANLLPGSAVLNTSDHITFSLSGLSTLTADAGSYVLAFDPTGVEDTDGNEPAAYVESWSVQVDVPDPVFLFATSDQNMRAFHSTTNSFSATFGVAASSWQMGLDYELFVQWRSTNDPLLKDPQTSAEQRSGESTGVGTYTMRQMWDYAAGRLRAAYPDKPLGVYLSAGYVWAPEWLYQFGEFTSVYPQGHVLWDDAFGFDGAASGWGITSGSAAISSVEDNGGYLKLNFASAICMPQWSIIKISSGASNASYAGQICNVREGSSINGGGTVTSITTDLAYDGTSTGGSIQGGARKAVNWSSSLFLSYFKLALLALVDQHRSRHDIQDVYFDEQAHEQTVPSELSWVTKVATFWADMLAELHARSLLCLVNITLHPLSKAYIMQATTSGGKVAFILRNRIMLSVGQTIRVAGNTHAGYNTTHTVANYVGRIVITNTPYVSAGTGGTLNNDDVQTQLDSFPAGSDGFSFEGAWTMEERTQAITPAYFANLRTLWNAGFTIVDIAQTREATYTITSSQNRGGYIEFTTSAAFAGPIGAKIGVWGHSVSGLNTTHYIRDVATNGANTFTVETAYSSDGTGGGLVYSDLGRLVPVDAVDNSGVGGRRRVTCAEAHHIFPMEFLSGAVSFYGSLYSGLSGTFTPVQVGALPTSNPTLFDIADTTSISISGRGYLVDTMGCRRFFAGIICLVREAGDRGFEWQDVGVGTPPWATWPLRLGAPSGAAVFTYSGGDDPRCTLITRTFANGTVTAYPQAGYVVTIINGASE